MGSWAGGGGGRRMPTAGAQEIVTKQTREIAKVNEDQFLPSSKSLHSRF